MGGRFRTGAGRVALVALLSALSLVFLYLSSFLPTGQMGFVAVAGLVLAAAVISGGLSAGFFCYGTTALLGFLIVPTKSSVVLYALFFGLYPMIKSLLEHLRNPVLEWVLKLLFFNVILAFCWFVLRELFLPFLPSLLSGASLIFAAGNGVFIVYDIGFSKLTQFYTQRIDKAIRK